VEKIIVSHQKRILALLTIFTLVVQLLLPFIPIALAAYPDNEAEFEEYLRNIGTEVYNSQGKKANFSTYKVYDQIVYGNQHGEWKQGSLCPKGGSEYEFLGYNYEGESVTNYCFPNDDRGNLAPEDWNFIAVDPNFLSWSKLDASQYNQTYYTPLEGHGATTLTVNSIGGRAFAEVQTAPTWKSSGSVYTRHRDSSGKIWYATFNVPPIANGVLLEGTIETNQATYTIPANSNSATVNYTVRAKASGSGKYFNFSQVKSLKAAFDPKGNNNLGASDYNSSSGQQYTLKSGSFNLTRDEYGVGKHTIKLEGYTTIESVWGDKDVREPSKTITLIVEPEAEKYSETTFEVTPEQTEFKNADVLVNAKVTGKLYGMTDTSKIKRWIFSAREKEVTTSVTQIKNEQALTSSYTFQFTIPKNKIKNGFINKGTVKEYLQTYVGRARVELVDGTVVENDAKEDNTLVYEGVAPDPDPDPEPEPPPNGNINAVITGPTEVEEERSFSLDGNQSTSTGKIVEWTWYEVRNGTREPLNTDFKSNWYRGADSPVLEMYDNNLAGGSSHTYELEIKDSNGRKDSAFHTIKVVEEVEAAVNADIQFELESFPDKISITREQYEADEEMTISGFVTAQRSQFTSGSSGQLWFFSDVDYGDIDGLKPEYNDDEFEHPNFRKYRRAKLEGYYPNWEESTVSMQFKFRPKSDPYIRAGLIARSNVINEDLYDAAVATMRVPLEIPPDFNLVIRPEKSWVYAGSDEGQHFTVYQDWDNKYALDAMNEEEGLVVENLNPDIASMEKVKFTDSEGKEYTSYYMKGLKEGQAKIKATYQGKTATATLDVYKVDLDIEPKNEELYVNTDYFIPKVKLLTTNPDKDNVNLGYDDPNLKLTFEPANAVKEIYPGIYIGVLDKEVKVTASYKGPESHEIPLSTSTTVKFKPHRPVAEISMPTQVYMDEPFIVTGGSSYSKNGSIVDYQWEISDPEKTIDGVSSEMSFSKEGEYDFTLTVTDNLGYKDTTTKTIKVLPNYPTAHFTARGTLKENRKVILDAGTSVGSTWGNFAVDHNKTEWEIAPADKQSPSSIHIVQNTNKQIIDVMFNEKGKYKVRVKVTNEKGASSDWYEETIDIEPDAPPIAQFSDSSPYFRDPENGNKATITLEDHSYSEDGDSIGEREWYYRFNPNKDGEFTNLPWIEIPDSKGKENVSFEVNDVGQYQIKLVVTESFGQPTIEEFYTPSLRKKAETEKIVLVDNKSPEVSFTDIGLRQKTQVVLMVDEDYPLTNEQLEQHFNQKLNKENIDVTINRIDGSSKKFVEAQNGKDYDDGLYKGTLEKYLYSGEYIPSHTKYVTETAYINDATENVLNNNRTWFNLGYFSRDYNKDGYLGALPGTNFQYVFSHSESGIREGNGVSGSWSMMSNSKSSLNDSKPGSSENMYSWIYEHYPNYSDVEITDTEWTGEVEGPGEYKCCSNNDYATTYSYQRNFHFFYTYKESYSDSYYDITITYGGNVTKPAVDTREYRYRGTVEKNIFTRLLDEIDWDMNVDRNIIYLSNDTDPNFNKGSENYTDVVNELSYQGINFYGIGSDDNGTQLDDVINGTGVEGKVFTTSSESDVNSSLENIADDIVSRMSKEPTTSLTVLLDEEFFPKTEYKDYENDPKIEERFKFNHSPNYFENPMGLHENHEKWLTSVPNSFNLVGKYVLNYQAKDDPVPTKDESSGFHVYRKWSNMANAVVYVHRKPNADFDAYFIDNEDDTYDFQIVDRSYDLDAYSQDVRGIKEKKWRFREVNGTWLNKDDFSQPTLDDFAVDGQYEIELTVEDYQGAFDTHREIVTIVTEIPNSPPVAGFNTDKSSYFIGDLINVTSTATDPDGDPLTYHYEITPVSGTKTIQNTPDFSYLTTEVGLVTIKQTVTDPFGESDSITKNVVVEDLTIIGHVKHTPKWLAIHQKLGNQLLDFYSGEKFLLAADITDAPVEYVKVNPIGELINGSKINDIVQLSQTDNILFEGSYYKEAFSTPGTLIKKSPPPFMFVFEVKYANGTVRTDVVNVNIIGSIYDVLKLHQAF
jgi:hypothetical protein